MFKLNDFLQKTLLPQTVDEYLEPHNLARFILQIAELLDMQPLIEKYSNPG